MISTTLKFIGKQQNNLHIGHRKFSPKVYKRNMEIGDLHQSNCINLKLLKNKKLFLTNMRKLIILNVLLIV